MKELLQIVSALPAPNPTTGLQQAINQQSQQIATLQRNDTILQDRMDILTRGQFYTGLLTAGGLFVVSIALLVLIQMQTKKLRRRIAKIERHLNALPPISK